MAGNQKRKQNGRPQPSISIMCPTIHFVKAVKAFNDQYKAAYADWIWLLPLGATYENYLDFYGLIMRISSELSNLKVDGNRHNLIKSSMRRKFLASNS